MSETWHDIENYELDTPVIKPASEDLTPYKDVCFSHSVITLTQTHIDALMRGDIIIWSDGEYSTELRFNHEREKFLGIALSKPSDIDKKTTE